MEKDIYKKITVECADRREVKDIATRIHQQLVGNPDYIGVGIVLELGIDSVTVYIGNEVEKIPELII